MTRDFIIGCVGKPSAGKSTFFNAVTEAANAKVGNYPFTTITPNQGIANYTTACPCKRFNVKCKPRYGSCVNGVRKVPVKLLDIAGLIPGASQGRGLGNKFLDDVRHADVLLHIIDVSGCTNEKGEVTSGYDPSNDHEWLVEEIELWIFTNLWSKWSSISRRHQVNKSTIIATLQAQLSGYDAKETMIRNVVNSIGLTDPVDLSKWDEEKLRYVVHVFVKHRFKFVLILNKADAGGDTDGNALKIAHKYAETHVVLCSALAECFLRKMKKQRYILYEESQMYFTDASDPEGKKHNLKPLDDKLEKRLKTIQDMVLYRYGSTGVQAGINLAIETMGMMVAYPVKNMHFFGYSETPDDAFPECVLIQSGTSVRNFAKLLHHEIERNLLYAEGTDGRRIGEDEVLTTENNIIRLVTSRSEQS